MTENNLGSEIIEQTRREERAREKEQEKGRETAVRMEEEQQRQGKKDQHKPILRS